MSKTNTTKTNGGMWQTLRSVAHSISNWFDNLVSFTDSSVADMVIEGYAEMRRQYKPDR